MEASSRDLMARLPWAEAVVTLWRWVADADLLDQIFEQNRGRCYETILAFSFLVDLIRAALLEFNGSGRRPLEKAQERGPLETSFGAVEGKLQRLPIAVSTALLGECTARLRLLSPEADQAPTPLPESLASSRIEIIDGQAIKRLAQRLKPLGGLPGGVRGGRAWVARDMRRGRATAMAAPADGDANDVRFVPDLVAQVRRLAPGRRLWLGDRPYCDLTQAVIVAPSGDAFLLRSHPKAPFDADPDRPACAGQDCRGRRSVADWGWLGSPTRPQKRLDVRRMILDRPGAADRILVTSRGDAGAVPAVELLAVSRKRWGIEPMFPPVVAVFGLAHLMGTTPQGTIGQFSLGLLWSNLIPVRRGVLAVETGRQRQTIAGEKLFEDVPREMIAGSITIRPEVTIESCEEPRTAVRVKARRSELLSDVGKDRWLKSPPRKRRPQQQKRTHSSVYRILEAHQFRLKKEKRGVAVA